MYAYECAGYVYIYICLYIIDDCVFTIVYFYTVYSCIYEGYIVIFTMSHLMQANML